MDPIEALKEEITNYLDLRIGDAGRLQCVVWADAILEMIAAKFDE